MAIGDRRLVEIQLHVGGLSRGGGAMGGEVQISVVSRGLPVYHQPVGGATGNVQIIGLLLHTITAAAARGGGDRSHTSRADVHVLIVRLHQRWHLRSALPEKQVLVGYVLLRGGHEETPAAVAPAGTPGVVS